jgi:hypothetical protein
MAMPMSTVREGWWLIAIENARTQAMADDEKPDSICRVKLSARRCRSDRVQVCGCR